MTSPRDIGDKSRQEVPVVKLADSLLAHAVERGATRLDLKSSREDLEARYTLPGGDEFTIPVPATMAEELIRRFVVLLSLEPFVTQDKPRHGTIECTYKGKGVRFTGTVTKSELGNNIVLELST